MAMPTKFVKPWTAVDPAATHGGIAGVLGPGWVAPDIGDNPTSKNHDIIGIFKTLNVMAQSISMHPEAEMEDLPGNSLLAEIFQAITYFFEDVLDRTKTQATAMFTFAHAIPPVDDFVMVPVMFPVRNPVANDFLFYALGTLVELAENSRNAVHKSLDPNASRTVMAPLYSLKADLMKRWFELEVEGEMSVKELNEILSGKAIRRPSYPDESSETPDAAKVADALKGYDVAVWLPTPSDWARFADVVERSYRPERVLQPEAYRTVTEDVGPESGRSNVGTPVYGTGGPNP